MKLASIWRHPIKAIGREEMAEVALTRSAALPFDRRWGVTHQNTKAAGPGWVHGANFLRCVSGPRLMAVTATLDGDRITLRHPDRPDLTVAPEAEAEALVKWLDPLWPADLPRPTGVAACATGFTDMPAPWISINSLTSHRAVEQRLGRDLSIHRWRGNLWVEGMDIWHEFDLVGGRIAIGEVEFDVHQPITRCKATMANPDTGHRDADTLAALRTWDHQDFGIYAEVTKGGTIRPGDAVRVL